MLSIDYRDARPVYEQVREGLRRLMVAGVIREGEVLPAVGTMASALTINPSAIRRAYGDLEAEGYLRTRPEGGHVAAGGGGVGRGRREALLRTFDQTAEELLFLGEDGAGLWARIQAIEGREGR